MARRPWPLRTTPSHWRTRPAKMKGVGDAWHRDGRGGRGYSRRLGAGTEGARHDLDGVVREDLPIVGRRPQRSARLHPQPLDDAAHEWPDVRGHGRGPRPAPGGRAAGDRAVARASSSPGTPPWRATSRASTCRTSRSTWPENGWPSASRPGRRRSSRAMPPTSRGRTDASVRSPAWARWGCSPTRRGCWRRCSACSGRVVGPFWRWVCASRRGPRPTGGWKLLVLERGRRAPPGRGGGLRGRLGQLPRRRPQPILDLRGHAHRAWHQGGVGTEHWSPEPRRATSEPDRAGRRSEHTLQLSLDPSPEGHGPTMT